MISKHLIFLFFAEVYLAAGLEKVDGPSEGQLTGFLEEVAIYLTLPMT